MSLLRTRWAAIGAAVAVALGAGTVAIVSATSPSDAVAFVPITPCRVIDTRPADQVGPRSTPLGPNDTHTVDAIAANADAGRCAGTIPAGATAISMNVTTVGATERTFLTIWAADIARPDASSLNPQAGQPPTPNAVTTSINSDGEFSIFNRAGSVHVLADINGYYTDHDHDDRYYTQQQVDDAIASATDEPPWSVGIPIGDIVNFSAFGPIAQGLIGIGLVGDSNSTVLTGFSLPSTYESGTDVQVDVMMGFPLLGGQTFPCTSVWRFSAVLVNRLDTDIFEPTSSWVQPGPPSDTFEIGWTEDERDRRAIRGGTVTIDGADLQPGDQINALLTRQGADADDTCSMMVVTGLTARASG